MTSQLTSTQTLLSAITRSKKPLTILLDSPVSTAESINSLGVYSVSELIGIIEEDLKNNRNIMRIKIHF